jgi:hypothetical protein
VNLYGIFRNSKWMQDAPVFTDKQTGQIWLLMRKPADGYKGCVVMDLKKAANELRASARKLLAEAERLEAVPVPLPGTDFANAKMSVEIEGKRGTYSSFGRGRRTTAVSGGLPGLGKKR